MKCTHDLAKLLVERYGVEITMAKEKQGLVYKFEIRTKSHLHITEDGNVYMRYGKTDKIDFDQKIDEILDDLSVLIHKCMVGRDYIDGDWLPILHRKYPELGV